MACNHDANGQFADLRQLFAEMQQAGFFNRKERCDSSKVVEKRRQRLADHGKRMAKIAAVVQSCPDCAVRFYRELLALLKDFAFPGNPDAILAVLKSVPITR